MEAAGCDTVCVDVWCDDASGLHDFAAELGAEGVVVALWRGDQVNFCGEHAAVAEGLLFCDEAFGEGERACVLLRRAVVLDAVVVCGVEGARLDVYEAVHVDCAGAAVCELEFAVAVRGVYVGDDLVPDAVLVVFWVVKVDRESVHVSVCAC